MARTPWNGLELLFEPVIPDTELDAIEFWIAHTQVCIGDVRPATAQIERLMLLGRHLDAATGFRREVK